MRKCRDDWANRVALAIGLLILGCAVIAQESTEDSRDAPPGSFSTEDLPWLATDDNEQDGTEELPAWVQEETIQPLQPISRAIGGLFRQVSVRELTGRWLQVGTMSSEPEIVAPTTERIWRFFSDGRLEIEAQDSILPGLWSFDDRGRLSLLWPNSEGPSRYGAFANDSMLLLVRTKPSYNRHGMPQAEVGQVVAFTKVGETNASGTGQPAANVSSDAVDGDPDNLAESESTLPGFQDRLDQVIESILSPPNDPGQSTMEWIGTRSRRPVGVLSLPTFASSDFGGLVPARVSYVVVFDVSADGLVVPGSIILRQSSGYTSADRKVVNAVASWRFEPVPGSRPVTAICTLVLERDNSL